MNAFYVTKIAFCVVDTIHTHTLFSAYANPLVQVDLINRHTHYINNVYTHNLV